MGTAGGAEGHQAGQEKGDDASSVELPGQGRGGHFLAMLITQHIHTSYHIYGPVLRPGTSWYGPGRSIGPGTWHAYVRTYVHTHIHTYINTYMHTYIHTYIHTCIHACIHTYRHTYVHTSVHTYIHTYIQTYRQTYRHTYIHRYIETYTRSS